MFAKRFFDIIFSFTGFLLLSPILFISYVLASLDTQSNGLFFQDRVGQYGKLFTIIKLKTIHPQTDHISIIGNFFRKTKIDEWPQLINVLAGEMSVVGPRPDVVGYYDKLEGENKKILTLKPGLTSAAALKYHNEEIILSRQKNPLQYNDEVIFPDKIKMNLEYYYKRNMMLDLKIIALTIMRIFKNQ